MAKFAQTETLNIAYGVSLSGQDIISFCNILGPVFC